MVPAKLIAKAMQAKAEDGKAASRSESDSESSETEISGGRVRSHHC